MGRRSYNSNTEALRDISDRLEEISKKSKTENTSQDPLDMETVVHKLEPIKDHGLIHTCPCGRTYRIEFKKSKGGVEVDD